MMRAAYVCSDPGVPVWGNKGCSIHVQGILGGLLRRGVQLDLIAHRLGGACPPKLESVTLHRTDVRLPSEPGERERELIRSNATTVRLLRTVGPFDFIYERYSLWSYAGMEFAHSQRIPGLLEVNAPLVDEQARHRVLVDREGAVEATRRSFSAASMILAVSDEVAGFVRAQGVEAQRIQILPNAIDPKNFLQQARKRTSSEEAFVIGFVGSLKAWHGVDRLIAAYADLWRHGSGWRLVIVGDGPCRERLRAQVGALPAAIGSSIEFDGAVPHAAVPQLLARMNVAVVPCSPESGTYFSPLKLFEYMAAGLPVVAASHGQVAAVIKHSETGMLYDPEEAGSLTRAILKLRQHPVLAERLGEQAQRDVLAHHTWDQRCERICRLVDGLRSRHLAPVAMI